MELKIRDGNRILLTNSKFIMSYYPNFQMKSLMTTKKKRARWTADEIW